MDRLEIKASYLQAAQLFAAKNDPRYYLKGILLTPENGGQIVATCGHKIIAIQDDELQALTDPIIIELGGSITGSADIARIDGLEDGRGIVTMYRGGNIAKTAAWSKVDANYPDYERVMPQPHRESAGLVGVGFNAEYVAICQKAARLITGKKDTFVKLSFGAVDTDIITVSFGAENVRMGVMPCRIK